MAHHQHPHHHHHHHGQLLPHHSHPQSFNHPLQFHPPPPPHHLLHQLPAPPPPPPSQTLSEGLLLPPPAQTQLQQQVQVHQLQQQHQQQPLPPPTVELPAASPSHYSLRWNNHQSHILAAFDALLQAETLVDVTLVCAETSVRAHKVVLSACSPFFQRIFSENPCKHPVIVLKDFNGWEVQAIVDFMYKGEISVGQEQLQDLIHAAESLQIRGLVSQDHIDLLDSKAAQRSPSPTPIHRTPAPSRSTSPSHHQHSDFDRNYYGGRFSTPQSTMTVRSDRCSSPFSPIPPPAPQQHQQQQQQQQQQASPSSVNSTGMKLPHMPQLSFAGVADPLPPPARIDCHSPIPRRKQARPRRRSGEMTVCSSSVSHQSIPHHNNNNSISSNNNNTTIGAQDLTAVKQTVVPITQEEVEEEVAENLSMKKPRVDDPDHSPIRERTSSTSSSQNPASKRSPSPPATERGDDDDDSNPLPPPPPPPTTPQLLQRLTPSSALVSPRLLLTPEPSTSPELDLSVHHHKHGLEFGAAQSLPSSSPPPPLPPSMGGGGGHPMGLPPGMLSALRHEMESHSPLHFPPMPSVSALTMTPPHIFGLDSPLGLFPPGLDGCRNPLLDMADHRTPNDAPLFVKKKMGRPKGQHSAPRGGPPRSWTNAELTEALQHVWNKKMTTSQASRIFGIPYNSLLMYVRGKYGKSLKLEQLRRDCIGGPIPLDMMGMEGGGGGGGGGGKRGHNNNNMSGKRPRSVSGGGEERGGPGGDHGDRIGNSPIQHNTRPSSVDDPSNHPLFNPFGPGGFYPDFGPPPSSGGGPPGSGPPPGFPLPVSMMHLLPQGDSKGRGADHPHHHAHAQHNPFSGLGPPPPHHMSLEEELSQHQQQLLQQAQQLAVAAAQQQQQQQQHGKEIKEEDSHQDLFSAMAAREREERRELLVHQNGQD